MANQTRSIGRSIQLLCAGALALLAANCSQGDKPEPTHAEQAVLVSPATITLAAPSPSSALSATVTGSNTLTLGAHSEVVKGVAVSLGTANLATQPDALLNETWSRGTAALNDRVKVRGTLHARARTLGANTSVTTWDQNPAFDPLSTLSWRVTFPGTTASNVTVNPGPDVPLSPGRYGALTVNSQATVVVRTGTYYLTSLALQSASKIKLDQSRGPVLIYVSDSTTLRGTCVPLSGTNCNWLVAHLGTTPVFVETLFDGAVLAPSAALTLRSVTGVHTGFFYAKDMALDAGARVQYRTPLAIIRADNPTGDTCVALTAGQVPPAELYKYCGGCDVPLDSDRDGVEDCADGCDFDPLKTTPGTCGCGVADTDTDGDGTADCLDRCDLDPNNTEPGQCGCKSSNPAVVKPFLAAGTRCTDSACPQAGTLTCNGAGSCGNPATCNPGGCRLVEHDRSRYWLCPGPVTQAAAEQACRGKQMALVRIDNFAENAFLKRFVTKPTWIGANSLATSGTWRWATSTSDSGDQFWAGTATGGQRNALFSFWATGSPAAQRCAGLKPGNARWLDLDCNESFGYICEYETPTSPLPPPSTFVPPAGDPGQPAPMSSSCVSTANSFLLPERATPTDDGINDFVPYQQPPNPGQPMFRGPSQSPGNQACSNTPAPSSALGASADSGCTLNVTPNETPGFFCLIDKDCNRFGTNLVCRAVPNDPTCTPSDTELCPGSTHCGTLVCPPLEQGVTQCDSIDICDPNTVFTDDSTGQDVAPAPFDPASLFNGTLPNVQPSAAYRDDPDGKTGKDHPWCWMAAQDPIPAANTAPDGKVGNANGGSKISFKFDPDLEFHANVNPLSLGDSDLDVNAKASLTAGVHLTNFLGLGTKDVPVLQAVASIKAHRCTISTGDTAFSVFGHNFVDLIGVPKFDTSDPYHSTIGDTDFYPFTTECNDDVGKVLTAVNRAKKAFRDAQQLLKQYNELKAGHLPGFSGLCNSVLDLVRDAGAEVEGFPDGLTCPANEPAEITINRFIDYYQAPGFGQIAKMRGAVGELSKVTADLFQKLSQKWEFGPDPFGESRTIYKADIQIGPVPLHLEVGAFYSYGAKGFFSVQLQPPFNPFEDPPSGQPERNPIATVRAGVMPFASAGLTAFVGAGKDLGVASATVGIEGSVKLADLEVPIFAGAGIGAEVQVDNRSFAPDVATALGAATGIPTHLNTPKSFKFFVWYEYGASLNATDILSGTVDGRLRIKFFFFSRTWRKRLASFTGLSPITVNFVSGKSGTDPGVNSGKDGLDIQTRDGTPATATTNVVAGTTDSGMNEAQVPLAVITPLTPPANPPFDDGTGATFNSHDVQGMFYDSLCCAKPGDRCPKAGERPERYGPVPCCPGETCNDQGTCEVECKVKGDACTSDGQCCPHAGYTVSCQGPACAECITLGDGTSGPSCNAPSDCCGGDTDPFVVCTESHTCTRACNDTGGDCNADNDCCPSMDGKHDVSCGTDKTCHSCTKTTSLGGQGATCVTDADCCEFSSSSNVRCVQQTSTHFECQHVIQ